MLPTPIVQLPPPYQTATAVSPGAMPAKFVNWLLVPVVPSSSFYTPGFNLADTNVFVGNGGRFTTNVEDENTVYPLDYFADSHVLGIHCTFVGSFAGYNNKEGNLNTFVGGAAGMACTIGDQDTYIGACAGQRQIDGYHNTYVGCGAGQDDIHGHDNVCIGTDNTLHGLMGHSNVGVGDGCGTYNNGSLNTYIGAGSFAAGFFDNPVTGTNNTCVGETSLRNTIAGSYNAAFGGAALFANTTGDYNVGLGFNALHLHQTGNHCIGIGYQAGSFAADGTTSNIAGTGCLYLGAGVRASASGNTNEIAIGYNAIGLGSNTIKIGGAGITKTIVAGALGIGTDAPAYPLGVKAASNNAWLAQFASTDAGNFRMNWGLNASVTPNVVFLNVTNDGGGATWNFYTTGAFVAPGPVTATFLKTSTAPTANSSGTVAIVAKDAGVATANAGWLPLKKSDDATVYVPFWT